MSVNVALRQGSTVIVLVCTVGEVYVQLPTVKTASCTTLKVTFSRLVVSYEMTPFDMVTGLDDGVTPPNVTLPMESVTVHLESLEPTIVKSATFSVTVPEP